MSGHLFNPAPRIGFAYDPTGSGKTAFRGGYGVFFEHSNGNEANTESLENSPPLAFAVTQTNIPGYTSIGSSAAGGTPVFPLSVNSIPGKATWPYIQQWHLDVQHQLPGNVVATVSYVGSKGTHLGRQLDLNQLQPLPLSLNPYAAGQPITPEIDDQNGNIVYAGDCVSQTAGQGGPSITGQALLHLNVACGADPNPFRHYLGYADINRLEFESSSTYHGLQFSARRAVGRLQLSFAYTYSHSIDDSSDRFDGSFVNSFNPSSNRASSNFDERHVLNFGYDWNLPFFAKGGLLHTILGGWEYSGVTTFNTGTPFSVTYADVSDNAGVANGVGSASRPDLVGDPNASFSQTPLQGFKQQFYNPAAFAAPRGLTFGTAGRNILRNPNRLNFDMALFKNFQIRESMNIEFRAEAFNVFNHFQPGNLGGDSGSAGGSGDTSFPANDFLYIASAHNPRILQLALKFIF